MASGGDISRANGRKGGRPKGSKAAHTLMAERGMAKLVEAYYEKVKPINDALIAKALTGDVPAIKELHERVHGKARQPVGLEGPDGKPLVIQISEGIAYKNGLNPRPERNRS